MHTYVLDSATFTIDTYIYDHPPSIKGQSWSKTLWVIAYVSDAIGYIGGFQTDDDSIARINSEIKDALETGNWSIKFTDDSNKWMEMKYGTNTVNMEGINDNTHLVMKDYIKYKGLEDENTKLQTKLAQLQEEYERLAADFKNANQIESLAHNRKHLLAAEMTQ
jgi:hypothetical protein